MPGREVACAAFHVVTCTVYRKSPHTKRKTMLELNAEFNRIKDMAGRAADLRGYL